MKWNYGRNELHQKQAIREGGEKKKKGGKWAGRKTPTFQKPKNWALSKKVGAKWAHCEKPIFLKVGTLKHK